MTPVPTFNLTKSNPTFNLTKSTRYSKFKCGLSWKPKSNRHSVDLDLSALFYSSVRPHVFNLYYGNSKAMHLDGSIFHSGDDLTGSLHAERDNESITLDLTLLPDEYNSILVCATVFGGSLSSCKSCSVSIRTESGDKIVSIDLKDLKSSGVVLCSLDQIDGHWEVRRVSVPFDFRTTAHLSSRFSREEILKGQAMKTGSSGSGSSTDSSTDSTGFFGFFSRLFGGD